MLRALIAQQSRDDQTWRLRPRRREVRATDLAGPWSGDDPQAGWDYLSNVPDHRVNPSVLVGVSKIWGAAEARFRPGQTCPACKNAIRRGRRHLLHFCLCCSASSDDPRQRAAQAPPPLAKRVGGRKQLKGGVGTAA